MRNILGLDLSLTSTGLALPDGTTRVLKPKSRGCERLDEIRSQILRVVGDFSIDFVAVEGYAFGRANQAHYIGELGGLIKWTLYEQGCDFVAVPPSNVKKYATGSGNANKDAVLAAAVFKFNFVMGNDEADALWLRAMAHDAFGYSLVDMPAKNRTALEKIAWEKEEANG